MGKFIKEIKEIKIVYSIHNFFGCNHFTYSKKNEINIGKSILKNCYIDVQGINNKVLIGDKCFLKGMRILLVGDNNCILIGNNVNINASEIQSTRINAVNGSKIVLGDHCLLSNNIELHTSDYHSILDNDGNRINYEKDIIIGNHVWIGLRSLILKGTTIEDNCIIGANSLLNKNYKEKNCIIAGNPAEIIKRDISWDLSRI